MIINVRLSVAVDEDAWCDVYGTELSEVQTSVRGYVLTAIQESAAAHEGAIRRTVLLS